MSVRREYDIAFVGLKPGVHEYTYTVGELFFESYPPQEFSEPNAKVRLLLEKSSTFMLPKFHVDGSVMSSCDRCGNPLKVELWDEFEMLVKLVDDPDRMNEEEEDPDVFYISRGESLLNVENWIYEFVTLSVPTHRICPEDEQGHSTCNQDVLKKISQLEKEKEETQNPLWKGLDKFRNL